MDDGISRLNIASQLSETIITDRNYKEHTQNNVNQKELPQLKKYFSPFTESETKLWTKSTWKPKSKECQGRSHSVYSQEGPSSKFYMFMWCVISWTLFSYNQCV